MTFAISPNCFGIHFRQLALRFGRIILWLEFVENSVDLH